MVKLVNTSDLKSDDCKVLPVQVRPQVPLTQGQKMKVISDGDFQNAINSNSTVIVQFSADWCGPCKRLSPVLENFASTREDLSVFKVDVEQSQILAEQFEIKSIPKVVLFRNGSQINESIGMMNEEKLQNFIAQ